MTTTEAIILAATIVGLCAIAATLIVSRRWPARLIPAASLSGEERKFLMDQLLKEREANAALTSKISAQDARISAQDVRIAALETERDELRNRINYVLSLMQGQAVAQSSVDAAMRPARPASAPRRQPAAQMTDGDVLFRDWLINHFDAADLLILCSDVGLERPPAGSITEMATSIVQAARRTGFTEKLEQTALDKRPEVEAWLP